LDLKKEKDSLHFFNDRPIKWIGRYDRKDQSTARPAFGDSLKIADHGRTPVPDLFLNPQKKPNTAPGPQKDSQGRTKLTQEPFIGAGAGVEQGQAHARR
jgi:hypothetical protein